METNTRGKGNNSPTSYPSLALRFGLLSGLLDKSTKSVDVQTAASSGHTIRGASRARTNLLVVQVCVHARVSSRTHNGPRRVGPRAAQCRLRSSGCSTLQLKHHGKAKLCKLTRRISCCRPLYSRNGPAMTSKRFGFVFHRSGSRYSSHRT